MTYKKFSPARRARDGAFSMKSHRKAIENGGGCDLSARCCGGIFGYSTDMLFKGKRGYSLNDRSVIGKPAEENMLTTLLKKIA